MSTSSGVPISALLTLLVVLAWDLVYLAMSFTARLPWSHCGNYWNTEFCRTTFVGVNDTLANVTASPLNASQRYVDPVVEFWE